eukprot:CAMPEP_0170515458 /NCGR_PEP_ID=MMETSP0209-20121228/1890_1 /TAXON_ID=665100 ORGANISM="Litonotus pictus, Strain P1" /NCGR_SAMPLE_ID=MMETSP0209 /ASSEMBLY_ACC=CAM_ASM_000301 /LENGTH=599 /DNA_ID=CAMNT_0010799959 /DNA_START=408 /DNA_END=2204 /DNA_ORIENTATION=+
MAKEAYEDYRRFVSDSKLNGTETRFFVNGKWRRTNWGKLKVGDCVMVKKDETIPADLLILECSNENGLCFVDTKNLDGETNLKEKFINKTIKDSIMSNIEASKESNYNSNLYSQLEGKLICDQPNEYLDAWEGSLFVSAPQKIQAHVTVKNLLVRGSDIKNTDFIIGLVVYCGHLTKIMKNAKDPPHKNSHVMEIMNKILISLFISHFAVVLIFTCLNLSFSLRRNEDLQSYIPDLDTDYDYKEPLVKFLMFYVSYSNVIPISLYVALEVLKVSQMIFIQYDKYIFHDGKAAECKTTDLIEELGQIDFVFSDKTGTLTMNEMFFRFCAINGKVYGKKSEENLRTTSFTNQRVSKDYSSLQDFQINGSYEAPDLVRKQSSESKNIENFFRVLSVCHSCVTEKKNNGELSYSSSSPDEIALVQGAANMGYVFTEKNNKYIIFENRYLAKSNENYQEKWELLAEIPFDSDRKRMSVIVKNVQSGDYYVFTKGADNIMLPRCEQSEESQEFCDNILYDFSCEGLRTLVMAMKKIDSTKTEEWVEKYNEANNSTDQNKPLVLNELYEEMENNLELVGISGIEDKLQEGVPESIEIIINANIRIW